MLHLTACDGHKLNILAEGVHGAVLFCFDETPRPNSFSFNICSGADRPIIMRSGILRCDITIASACCR